MSNETTRARATRQPTPQSRQAALDLDTSSAVISSCGCYRYRLDRRWSDGGRVVWIMLNPSTADASANDPTLLRVIAFSRSSGFGACTVGNLFAWRATDPAELREHPSRDIVGPENDASIRAMLVDAAAVIVAWGGSVPRFGVRRIEDVLAIIREAGHEPLALRVTKAGQPCHPLYLPGALRPVPLCGLIDKRGGQP